MTDQGKNGSSSLGDIEPEVRSRQPASVLLVASTWVGSAGLRAIIQESPDLRLIAEVSDRAAVVSTARTRNPDHIVVAGDGVTQAQLVLLHELRRTSPNSALVVCTERSDRDTVMALGKVPVGGILVWADVTAEALHRSLVLVSGGLHVMSRHAMEALVRPAGQRSSEATLSDLERRIIHGLDQELSEQEIAEAEAMSLSTVRRTVRSVKAKLGVRSLYRVGRMVERLGLSD